MMLQNILLAICMAAFVGVEGKKGHPECGSLVWLAQGNGELVSHKTFGKCAYPVGMSCTWEIDSNVEDPYSRLSFSFESYEMPLEPQPCARSYLRFHDRTDPSETVFKSLCQGRAKPEIFSSTSNKVKITFKTSSLGAKGFKMKLGKYRKNLNACPNPANETMCDDKLKCFPTAKKCDNHSDCHDGSDEKGCLLKQVSSAKCTTQQFQCKIPKCVDSAVRCNTFDNCGDNSDEEGCAHTVGGPPCVLNHIFCPRNKTCISATLACNGKDDCGDNSDEQNCDAAKVCKTTWHRCANSQYISLSQKCDGTHNCADGSDEAGCPSD